MATIKKGLNKAKNGGKTTTTKTTKKPADANTIEQKNKFDARYNEIYNQTKNDSITESNKTIGRTYLDLKNLKGKAPSAADLRAAQDFKNKLKVANTTPGNKTSKLNAKQRADDRFEQEMSGNDDKAFERLLDRNGGTHKKKMRNGGSLSGLKASTKRDNGIDPKGAFTKVQKKTLKGAKGKASLTKDKQLGATKMKMGGRMKKC